MKKRANRRYCIVFFEFPFYVRLGHVTLTLQKILLSGPLICVSLNACLLSHRCVAREKGGVEYGGYNTGNVGSVIDINGLGLGLGLGLRGGVVPRTPH